MGRPPRHYAEGIYHVAAHASDDRVLFRDDADRRIFLARFSDTFLKLGLRIVSYVLMTNHYHAAVATPDDRLARALQSLHGSYAALVNRRHGRRAHLFRAHCLARRVDDDLDLLGVARYLAHNPVKAGLIVDPLDWPWSSAPAHAGVSAPAFQLDEEPLRSALFGSADWRDRYRQLVSASAGSPGRPSTSPGRASAS